MLSLTELELPSCDRWRWLGEWVNVSPGWWTVRRPQTARHIPQKALAQSAVTWGRRTMTSWPSFSLFFPQDEIWNLVCPAARLPLTSSSSTSLRSFVKPEQLFVTLTGNFYSVFTRSTHSSAFSAWGSSGYASANVVKKKKKRKKTCMWIQSGTFFSPWHTQRKEASIRMTHWPGWLQTELGRRVQTASPPLSSHPFDFVWDVHCFSASFHPQKGLTFLHLGIQRCRDFWWTRLPLWFWWDYFCSVLHPPEPSPRCRRKRRRAPVRARLTSISCWISKWKQLCTTSTTPRDVIDATAATQHLENICIHHIYSIYVLLCFTWGEWMKPCY